MKILKQAEYYGSQRRELQLDGLSISEYDYLLPDTPWHYHENPYFMYVMQGQMKDINKRQSTNLNTGSLSFLNWEEPHKSEKHSTRGRGFHLQIDRKWLMDNDLNGSLWEGGKRVDDPWIHHLIAEIYFEFHQKDTFSPLSIELLVLRLCERLRHKVYVTSNKIPAWMSRLIEMIVEDNISSLKSLSESLGVHPVHISRSFPVYFGKSLGAYIRAEKVKKALPALLDGNISIAQIASDCGFSDQSHFTRVFKSFLGSTPKVFQRSVAG